MLGYEQPLDQLGWESILSHSIPLGQRLKDPQILFIKIEEEQIEQCLDNRTLEGDVVRREFVEKVQPHPERERSHNGAGDEHGEQPRATVLQRHPQPIAKERQPQPPRGGQRIARRSAWCRRPRKDRG